MGKLILVPTPVGNMEDMTFRAVRVLREADAVLAEDTRTTGILMKHYEIRNSLQSHHKYNEHRTAARLAERIRAGETVALVSDAGTPSISDPGYLLVRECVRQGVTVECLPGATALIPALAVSGLPNDRFRFEGFLPVKKGRQARLSQIAAESCATVLYESPFRLLKTLSQLAGSCGGTRPASVSREISKLFEETVRGTLDEIISHFTASEPKGECVIVVGGNEKEKQEITANH